MTHNAKMDPAQPFDSTSARQQGFALREEQRLVEAEAVFAAGARSSPQDVALVFALAQTRYELGYPAADLFAQAARLAPDHPEITRNQALALISEQRFDEARALLVARLSRHLDWLDGHKALATLNWTQGDQQHFSDHLAEACRAQPNNQSLWLAWFRNLAQARDWPAALAVLYEAERHLGKIPPLIVSRLFVAVESGSADAQSWIEATANIRGDVTSLCRIRHALRSGDPGRAAQEALVLTAGASAMLYWPYLSLAWRMLGDARAEWLDRPFELVASLESGWNAAELQALAEVLRGMHTAARPYIEQSVRGGTQTDRSVLLRHEPELRAIKARLLDLLRDYVDHLPPHDPTHPLLSAPRNEALLIEGSWSVRLARQGYNVPHTHAMGWLSTAFYVSLPEPQRLGPPPAGQIAFGVPPTELGLDLPAYRMIEPAPGRLAVFPSTMWHSTVPFDDGERLVIAFDIKRPKGA